MAGALLNEELLAHVLVAVSSAARAVIATDFVPVALVPVSIRVELRRVLDLVLRATDEDFLVVEVGVTKNTGRQ